ncbi:acetate--CoA ligase [Flavihumibacter rivuli]|nr:acetate--CoA ligase [Flavihumibacter rivuli]
MPDYEKLQQQFNWEAEMGCLDQGISEHGLNIGYEALDKQVKEGRGDTTALCFIGKQGKREFSYAALQLQTNRFANLLHQLGIRKGDRVCTLTGRIPELYIAALGTLKAGAVYCPLFSVFGPEPIFQRLSRGKIRLLVTTSRQYEQKIKPLMEKLPDLAYVLLTDSDHTTEAKVLSLPQLMEASKEDFTIPFTQPEDAALLHFTSGTTGMPKGAVHVHKAILTHYITGKYVLDFQQGDRFWCTADPGWVTGTSYGIIAPLVCGITNIIDEEEFDAARWMTILEAEKVNIWYTAPTSIRRLMRMNIQPRETHDLSHLRLIGSVGEPLSAEGVEWGRRAFGMPILDNWWQTETGGIMIANFPSLPVKPGSMGKPIPGIEAAIAALTEEGGIRIISDGGRQGHLVIRKGWPSMFRTYLNEEERYAKCFRDEWYITGDLARKDEAGYYWFVGRADDIIKTSGHMVGPFEVESALMQHPAVAEAAIIGKPDPMIGELVKAFIVLKQGYAEDETTRMDIMGFIRRKLGAAVAPREISFIKDLPKTRSGKILRRLLKARELGLPEGDLSTLEQQ